MNSAAARGQQHLVWACAAGRRISGIRSLRNRLLLWIWARNVIENLKLQVEAQRKKKIMIGLKRIFNSWQINCAPHRASTVVCSSWTPPAGLIRSASCQLCSIISSSSSGSGSSRCRLLSHRPRALSAPAFTVTMKKMTSRYKAWSRCLMTLLDKRL